VREIETDYLVVGAGASGMAFVDALLAGSDAEVVLVDRRHRPGGHWLDAYPFVRLHQPSANYGVDSRRLGDDRIDEIGPYAGFYERATAAEICDYYGRTLDEQFVPSGRVQFLGMTDYRGSDGDGHQLVSLLTGEPTVVRVRRRLVDATYVESAIPKRHTRSFAVDDGARVVPPNDLVELAEPATGFTVFGSGKTAMDTCGWLLDTGVDPDRIRWFRPSEPWAFSRALNQPLELVAAYVQLQAIWVAAAAEAEDGADMARRMEAEGLFLRIDPAVEPTVFRGPILSTGELEALRTIERVVRGYKVQRVGTHTITTDQGDIETAPGEVHIDCTAAGVRPTVLRPVFEPDRITVQLVTIGIVPWSAATIGFVESRDIDDADKNRLCPPVSFTGQIADLPKLALAGMTGLTARAADPDVSAWTEACRLNPSKGATERFDDPKIAEAFTRLGANLGPAFTNLERMAGAGPA
jgi:hypothetical protein